MADMAMAYIVMAYIVMAHVVMAYVVAAYGVMAYVVMAHAVMAYTVMACWSKSAHAIVEERWLPPSPWTTFNLSYSDDHNYLRAIATRGP